MQPQRGKEGKGREMGDTKMRIKSPRFVRCEKMYDISIDIIPSSHPLSSLIQKQKTETETSKRENTSLYSPSQVKLNFI